MVGRIFCFKKLPLISCLWFERQQSIYTLASPAASAVTGVLHEFVGTNGVVNDVIPNMQGLVETANRNPELG